jgi:phosphoribosylformylglycinamidine (FGAM) synthase-like amidotransferase family enzyme
VSVKVNILYLPGTNCQRETAFAFSKVGADPRYVLLNDLLAGRDELGGADIVCLPGGFSSGDDTGAGNVAAWILRTKLADELRAAASRPMLCVCNGFQIGIRAGLFGDATLTVNSSATFYDEPKQRHLVADDNDSPWLAGLGGQTLAFPCAHGEGRFIPHSDEGWKRALTYPADRNPDGSTDDIAGVTSPDGMILGMMNHPERAAAQSPEVLTLFENAVSHVRA